MALTQRGFSATYGFYEGKDTPYWLDPATVVEVLDFLTHN